MNKIYMNYFTDKDESEMSRILDAMTADGAPDTELVLGGAASLGDSLVTAPDDDLVHVSDLKQLFNYIKERDAAQHNTMMMVFDKHNGDIMAKLATFDSLQAKVAELTEQNAKCITAIDSMTKSINSLSNRLGRFILEYEHDIDELNTTQKSICDDIHTIKQASAARTEQLAELSDRMVKESTYHTRLCMDIINELQHNPAPSKKE